MKKCKSFKEQLKGNQHKLDVDGNGKIEAEDLAKLRSTKNEDVERVARADYKISPSGRKSHKEIVFHTGDAGEEQEKKQVQEEMTDDQMKKREEIVKSMKKNIAGFKSRYGDDAKQVMYATATKMAMKEDLDESKSLKDIAAAAERRAGSVMKPKAAPTQSSTKTSLSGIRAAAERRKMKENFELDEVDTNILSYKDFMSSLLEYKAKSNARGPRSK